MQSETSHGSRNELKLFAPGKTRQAIRAECLKCKGRPKRILLCSETTCPNHSFRLTPIEAHRARCLGCVEGTKAIRLCATETCTSHPYRFGKRPNAPKGGAD
jgi:hypothetical protein